jgi:S-adenosylmethionine decarboxylase
MGESDEKRVEDFLEKSFPISRKKNLLHHRFRQTPTPLNRSQPLEVQDPSAIKGHHIIANFAVNEVTKLHDSLSFRSFINLLIEEFRLSKIGEVYHDFENGGFTAIVCLTESHLSVHTWPDQNYLTFDVFLSNYMRDNYATAQAVYHSVRTFFDATVTFEQKLLH